MRLEKKRGGESYGIGKMQTEIIMLEKLGGRKFVFAILAAVLGFVLVIVGKVEANVFLDFVKWIAGIFVVGNAAVDITGIIKENGGDE